MGRLYSWFALFLQGLLIFLGLFFYIGMHPETTRLLAKKVLEPASVGYEKIEGSLPFGFDLYGVAYQKALVIGHLQLTYRVWELLLPTPMIRGVKAEKIDVWPERFEKSKKETAKKSPPIALPSLRIMHIGIKEGTIHLPERIALDADAGETLLSLHKPDLSIDTFSLQLKSPWASGRLQGRVKNRAIDAKGYAVAAERYRKEAAKHLSPLPQKVPFALKATLQKLDIHAALQEDYLIKEANATLQKPIVDLTWYIEPNYFTAKATYGIETGAFYTDISHSLLFTPSLAYATKIEGKVRRCVQPLPFTTFHADAAGDRDVVTADIYANPFTVGLYSEDYNHFAMQASAKPHRLDYIKKLPDIFASQKISLEANATAQLTPDAKAQGVVLVDGNFSTIRSSFELSQKSLLARSIVTPKDTKGGIWNSLPPSLAIPVEMVVYLSPEEHLFNLSAKTVNLTLFEKRGDVLGWANLGCLELDANGSLHPDGTADIDFFTEVESVRELLEDLKITSPIMVDAEVHSRFGIHIGKIFTLHYKTDIPWYVVEPDSQSVIYGTDSVLEGGIEGEDIRIDRYHVCIADHCFDASRPSHFHVDENLTLYIDSLALLDHATARGELAWLQNRGKIDVKGEDVHYNGPEGNVTANLNIDGSFCAESMRLEGEVAVTDALITYKPQREYTVNDEDIVIIQDIKEPSHTKKIVDLHIYANRPLRYKTDMVDARFLPDITLWKEAFKPLTILGIVKITEGTIDVTDKHFTIEPSEIYFQGAHPINPYLELHIVHTVDFKKFFIYVSHTLADPVFFFSSEPPMSQSDIMSYILFGAPANEAFSQSQQAQSNIGMMLLGVGLKNAIGSATGIKFDTLNILTTQEGGFGIEIGKRLGSRLRIVYRNDTVSSFIIQYTASKSIRIDVDVHETGQGVKVLYIKDIR